MPDKKPTRKEVEALETQIKADQEKTVRGNERRVRIGSNLKDAVQKMSITPPVSNKSLTKWAKKQRKAERE
jgi:hypothetical protein